jgi:DNA invertase Pin-like site-specific DNA recombinase
MDGSADRPGLKAALDYLRPGDTLVVHSLSRLASSVRHLLEIEDELSRRHVELQSLRDDIDTRTPNGSYTFVVLKAVAQLERDILIERTRDGLEAARARGRVGGRPRTMTPEKVTEAKQMLSRGSKIATVARRLGVSRASIYRTALYELTPWGRRRSREGPRHPGDPSHGRLRRRNPERHVRPHAKPRHHIRARPVAVRLQSTRGGVSRLPADRPTPVS